MAFDKNCCTMVSNLNRSQLLEFLKIVNNEEFMFRSKLVLDSSITYGNEIEVNDLDLEQIETIVYSFNTSKALNSRTSYIVKEEMTAAGEVVTPVLFNSSKCWDLFYEMYKILDYSGATVGQNTSSHVHLGMQHINNPKLLSNFLKMLVVFEPIIFKFGYGYDDKPRDYIRCIAANSNYAMMASPRRYSKFIAGLRRYNGNNEEGMQQLFDEFLARDLEFRPAFNFKDFCFDKLKYDMPVMGPKDFDHMEIRCFNGTLDPVIGQNNINLVTHILEAVIMDRIDQKYLDMEYQRYRKKRYNFDVWRAVITDEKEAIRYNRLLNGFSEIKLEKALKLADMIFTNDLDKVYFLKQYLKLFQINDESVKRLVLNI